MLSLRVIRVPLKIHIALLAFVVALSGILGSPDAIAQATCATTTSPATTFGQVKQTVSVTTPGTYRVWSRIKAPNSTNNSYYLQINTVNANCAINVGDTTIPTGAWTWVSHKNASTSSFIDVTLGAGSHTFTYTGKEADVQLDRVLLLADSSCGTPTGTGDNCAQVDTVKPTVTLTSPSGGSSITKGTAVTMSATAQDNTGVTKVEFYVDGAMVNSDSAAPYSFNWTTTSAALGQHSLTARAYDAANNNTTSSAALITLIDTDTAPTVNITAPAAGSSSVVGTPVNITATAQDNTGVTKVEFYVDNVLKSTDTSTPYAYSWPTTGVNSGTHNLVAKAYDAGNRVGTSQTVGIILTNNNPVPGLNGDANGDGKVNGLDYSVLQAHDGENYPAADFDKDGTVGAGDLAILLSRWTW